jgi:hypothetical protein
VLLLRHEKSPENGQEAVMTSEEIRREEDFDDNRIDKLSKNGETQRNLLIALQLKYTREIALQLAELNEHIRDDKKAINVVLCASNDLIPVRVFE